MSAVALARLLTDPGAAAQIADWPAVLSAARAEQLVGSLAYRLDGLPLPAEVAGAMAAARGDAVEARRGALWEAEAVRRALAGTGARLVLLKGTAFHAAGRDAARGRHVGDLDLLVERGALAEVEAALRRAGWEDVKANAYDDAYYRRWMHELPPLIHRDRDRLIDVHHTILPPTARLTPDAGALLAAAVPLGNGLHVLSPEDMVVHAALHLLADGDLAGGLRNLWDIDRLLREFAEAGGEHWWLALQARVAKHQAGVVVARALRLAAAVFGTPVPEVYGRARSSDGWFRQRLLARDGWGRETRAALRFAFYVRSHWMRMPPALLLRHLAVKAWRGAGRG